MQYTFSGKAQEKAKSLLRLPTFGRARSAKLPLPPAPAPAIPDWELDDALRQMVATLGLGSEQAERVFKLPNEAKREMLKVSHRMYHKRSLTTREREHDAGM